MGRKAQIVKLIAHSSKLKDKAHGLK